MLCFLPALGSPKGVHSQSHLAQNIIVPTAAVKNRSGSSGASCAMVLSRLSLLYLRYVNNTCSLSQYIMNTSKKANCERQDETAKNWLTMYD